MDKTNLDSGSSSRITVCSYGEDCYRQNPKHFEEFSHPHLEDLITKMSADNMNLPADYKQKISRRILEIQITFQRNLKKYGKAVKMDTKTENSINKNSAVTVNSSKQSNRLYGNDSTSSCSTSSKVATLSSISQSESKPSAAQNYRTVVLDRIKSNIVEKWKEAAPYHFFLSAISDSKPTHLDRLTVHFPELLDPRLGDLKESLQINFMVELGWLLAQYYCMGHSGKPLTLVYGEGDENMDKCPKHVTPVKITCPSPFGTHHTKMSVLLYTDNSLRVIVSTGNLVESDWDNRVQGVWISPRCPQLAKDGDTGAGESPTNFKKDLLQYLSAYKRPELQEWVSRVRRTDFSEVKVFFIASTPGTYRGLENDYWAQGKLSKILKSSVKINQPTSSKSHLIAQCSSIGSLGPEPNSWLCGQIQSIFSQSAGFNLSPTHINLIYPSFENVANSHDGLLGGGCLPYSKKTHEKQLWLHKYLCQWKSDKQHRTKAMPHIKTYCRITQDWKRLAWFLLTSANMSKAAWGNSRKPNSNYIMSYEAGVLFIPKYLINKDEFPIVESNGPYEGVPVFPMPYDVPVTPYNSTDVPWFFENFQ